MFNFLFIGDDTIYFFFISDNPDVFVGSNDEGIERVEKADGKYAFFMESSSIQYIIERNCAVTQIGGTLDTKVIIRPD